MLKQFFVGRQCTVLFLDDWTAPEDDRQLQSIAHGVILLEQHASDYGNERRRLRAVKVRGLQPRGGDHELTSSGVGCRSSRVWWRRSSRRSSIRRSWRVASPTWTRCSAAASTVGRPRWSSDPPGPVSRPWRSGMRCLRSSAASTCRCSRSTNGSRRSTCVPAAWASIREVPSRAGRLFIKQIDPAEMGPGEFVASVNDAAFQDKTRVIIIDSLNGYLNAMPEERALALQLHELLTVSGPARGVDVPAMAQHGILGPAMVSPIDVSYLADTVVMLRYFEAEGAIRKAISVSRSAAACTRRPFANTDGSARTESASGSRSADSGAC